MTDRIPPDIRYELAREAGAEMEEAQEEAYPSRCPGCGGLAGPGPEGCCRRCWVGPKKRRKITPEEE